ncbi:GNAT family N-acetyltransferase [Clostridium grantii]|uniref:Acetyltransferase (GNAT) family protein n=1 Tax=Clostridium grantii DSM 8605 TaxID=1121316 RepID=A0A1M5XWL0_9CLOT|nr:GNAT family N-acetyltransferase [Clostridium grantii]SHI04217.1 Acetyltransferase (GNAT) family protein [Clostridium grantii DSM 8605]
MIKKYLELNELEVRKLNKFINRNKENKVTIEEMDKQLRSEEYAFGEGIILAINHEDVIARIQIILIECMEKKVAYAINLDIKEEVKNKKKIASELIEAAKNIAKKHKAQKLFLGTTDDILIKTLNSLSLHKEYSSIRMILKDRKIRDLPLNLTILTEENKNEYLRIHNDAFKEVPNGGTLTESKVDEYIKNADDNNCYYIVTINNEMIGMLQFNIEERVGEFELGLIKEARGKGYGKRLLETAINFLNSREVTEINLIVITKNTPAYNMYINRGFKESELINEWFEINVQ